MHVVKDASFQQLMGELRAEIFSRIDDRAMTPGTMCGAFNGVVPLIARFALEKRQDEIDGSLFRKLISRRRPGPQPCEIVGNHAGPTVKVIYQGDDELDDDGGACVQGTPQVFEPFDR